MRRNPFLVALAGVMLAAGCHSGKPATTTPPEPSAAEIARQKQIQDSLDAIAAARSDSVERARQVALAEQQVADSIEAARVAAEAAVRDSLERVKAQSDALRDELGQVIHFDVASAQLSTEVRAVLDRKAEILAANPGVQIQITGAADERGPAGYNMALGERRARAAKRYLVEKGVATDRLDQNSIGEESPVDPGHDEAAWQQNRRAEFTITAGDGALAMNQ